MISRFPYYIVRFKLILAEEPLILGLRFHTTQYDLNSLFLVTFLFLHRKFPYYIVRFKLFIFVYFFHFFHSFHTTQYDLNLIVALWEGEKTIGFHTTQYDLNIFLPSFHPLTNLCFHTTQYDLNRYGRAKKQQERVVSILHSTI